MVINGPVANAGSIFRRSSVIGTSVPKILANITTANKLRETEAVIPLSPSIKKLYMNTTRLMMLALINETIPSFNICGRMLSCFNELLARPCTTMADDCMPTFPPVPPIRGINKAILGLLARLPSNPPRITEFASPPIIPISNQGRRAAVCVNTLSEVSTSCEIPDANW